MDASFWSCLVQIGRPSLLAQRNPAAWTGIELALVFADLATFAAFAVIPLLILYFLLRRRHVYFSRVWFLLLAYLVVGATVHVLDACGGWAPVFTAAMKVALA